MNFKAKLLKSASKEGWVKDFLSEVVDNGECYVWKNKTTLTVLNSGANGITLNRIHTPETLRRQGYARQLMEWLCALADKHQITYFLVADKERNEGGMSNKQLQDFYASFGFVRKYPNAKANNPLAKQMKRLPQ